MERRYDLDWLRVLAVLLLIYFHTAAIFYRGELGEFYVVNSETSQGLALFILVVHQWHMPLFFFLSGAATWFSLRFRSAREYIQERVQRLLIPLVVGTLALVPPQVYFHRLATHTFQGSYLDFYPQFFQGIRPEGNFEWAHLWFIAYLLVISLVALPGLLFSRRWPIDQLAGDHPGALVYPAVLLALIEAGLRPHWPGFQNLYNDWANVCLYFTYFVYGYGFAADPQWGTLLDRYRPWLVAGAIATMAGLVTLWVAGGVPPRSYSPGFMAYQAVRGATGWCWVLMLVSLARAYLNVQSPLLRYASEAAYPVYILHQTVVVGIGFYLVSWSAGIPTKFLVISTVALLGTLGLYEGLVRRVRPLRLCFGLKPDSEPSGRNQPLRVEEKQH